MIHMTYIPHDELDQVRVEYAYKARTKTKTKSAQGVMKSIWACPPCLNKNSQTNHPRTKTKTKIEQGVSKCILVLTMPTMHEQK